MANRIKDVVDNIKMKDHMQEEILSNLESKIKYRRTKSPIRKIIIAICSLVLVLALWNNTVHILNPGNKNEKIPSNNLLFTVSVYAMESDGNYTEKTLLPNLPEDVPLVSLADSSKVCVFSLKEFGKAQERYYFDIYDEETNEDIDFQIDSTKFKGEDGSLNLIIDPNTMIIYPKEGSTKIIIDAYNFDNELVESVLLKIEETKGDYKVEIIEHDETARANNKDNISIEEGRALFVKVGTFEIPYATELNYKRFSEMGPLDAKYTKETPYNDKWGRDQITYIDYVLNKSEIMAKSDIPFSADIYTMNGDMIASVKSIYENDNYNINIKFPNKRYYILLVNEDGKSTENGSYSIWK